MLDVGTRRRIDTARDILVGKLPDPKSQVEQITIALIYKFMDDMDREALELGGKAKFLTGEYQRYAWSKIFDPRLSGYELVNVYGEALQKMNLNPNIPQLFRDIFKNAFLPYRDPETLKSFLKIINDFEYDLSEKLGDAFEYLLSVLGSQGEAGQFRTPRHIIDFMVAIVDPKKNESILDPACGTAGFLISSYKHILKHNSENFDPERDPSAFELHGVRLEEITINSKRYSGDKLTSDDKERLVKNIIGYDIAPDMVRLSLVNMYLHGFSNPCIFEYDTLTSEEKWNEYADVIMANPPFMSPKGGIRPHKRFSTQSSRSEVLFVDYIAEHLTPQGRAAVIVPEGIIFQTQTAHRNLRKMLIEKNYLVGVISLPAGVFNPYSGVKTSILWMDKTLAKKTDRLIFVKIENDGFNLGAQRRPIKQNDLPNAFHAIQEYRKSLDTGGDFDADIWQNVLIIHKSKITENDAYNLIAEHYKPAQAVTKRKWPMVKVGEVCEISTGNPAPQDPKLFLNGRYPFYRTSDVGAVHLSCDLNNVHDWLNDDGIKGLRRFEKGTILFPKSGASTFLNHRVIMGLDGYVSSHLATIRADEHKISNEFLYYLLIHVDAKDLTADQSYPSLKTSAIAGILIPLPPLEVQEQTVTELSGYQKIIDAARQIVAEYEPEITANSESKLVSFGNEEVVEIIDGDRGVNYPPKTEFSRSGYCVFLNTKNVTQNGFVFDDIDFLSKERDERMRKGKLQKNDIVLTTRGTVGNSALNNDSVKYDQVRINSGMVILRPNTEQIDPYFLWTVVRSKSVQDQFERILSGTAQPQLPIRSLIGITFPLPDLETQKCIVRQIEKEQEIVNSTKQLIGIFEQKVRDCIASVWGEK